MFVKLIKINVYLYMDSKELKEILTTRGVKQSWVAEKLRVSDALVSQWLKGEKDISERHKIELKAILK